MRHYKVRRLKAALHEATRLGLVVEKVKAAGEVKVRRPDGGPFVRLNVRRKDAPLALVKMIEDQKEQDR